MKLVGGFNPSEKYESQLGLLSPIYGKIKNDPNHQPEKQKHVSWLPCAPMVLEYESQHVPEHAGRKSSSHVGKYTSTME